jgi:hypothetical protein
LPSFPNSTNLGICARCISIPSTLSLPCLPSFFVANLVTQTPSHPLPLTPRHLRALRFSDLVFVGYTADGYKKGLCHETPTAEELAGCCIPLASGKILTKSNVIECHRVDGALLMCLARSIFVVLILYAQGSAGTATASEARHSLSARIAPIIHSLRTIVWRLAFTIHRLLSVTDFLLVQAFCTQTFKSLSRSNVIVK